jgi:tRNA nucleotidyltransferase (CCA-adding enzyme)
MGETSIGDRLAALPRLRPVLEAVAGVRDGQDVYVVGGTVRDILLGEPGFDVDLTVEGDGVRFAEALARRLGGRVRSHDAFGTAVVEHGDAERVDVVTARRERYESPAALPVVEPGTIDDDLARRDFTINAMAASLGTDDLGRLVDPFHGRDDLDARTIRVLHDGSFVDDPTRIFRAIRYASRYGFELDDQTLELARSAIEGGLVARLTPARLRDELVLLLDEPQAAASIRRLGELGPGSGRATHEEAAALFERLRELRDEYALAIPSWRLGLAALCRGRGEDAHPRLEELALRRQDAQAIAAAVSAGPRLAEELREARSPADVVALVEPYPEDAPLMALALADRPALRDYFERLRGVRLEVDGADLAGLGLAESPRVGEVLAELRRRKLNGELDGRDSELAAARELIAQCSAGSTRPARTRSSSRRARVASAKARTRRSTSGVRPRTSPTVWTRTAGGSAPRSARSPTRWR